MIAFLWAALAVLAALVFLLLGAQIEMFRSLEQLREYAGAIDRPIRIELGDAMGEKPSLYGLPEALDFASSAVLVFLSDKCGTCRTIAAALAGNMPAGLTVVVDAGGAGSPEDLVVTHGLDPSRTIIDHDRQIISRLGIDITPSGLVIENGRLVRATTVPSTRQLYTILETAQAIQADVSRSDTQGLTEKEVRV